MDRKYCLEEPCCVWNIIKFSLVLVYLTDFRDNILQCGDSQTKFYTYCPELYASVRFIQSPTTLRFKQRKYVHGLAVGG